MYLAYKSNINKETFVYLTCFEQTNCFYLKMIKFLQANSEANKTNDFHFLAHRSRVLHNFKQQRCQEYLISIVFTVLGKGKSI